MELRRENDAEIKESKVETEKSKFKKFKKSVFK